MKQSVKAVLIAAGVLLVLGIALAVILLVPEKTPDVSEPNVDLSHIWDDGEEQLVPITSKPQNSILELSIENEKGSYAFTRHKRDSSYYWTTDALGEVLPDEAAIGRFVDSFTFLCGSSVVEENASALDKYGLDDPLATVGISFEDGTSATLLFGIKNPVRDSYAYCCESGSGRVILVEYSAVEEVYSDAKAFAKLVLTEEYSEKTGYPEYIRIERKDLETPVELRYMSELEGADEELVITTSNLYRFTEPISAEIDASRGENLYRGVCGLTMRSCEFLEQSEENLKACGLDDPFAKVTFQYNGTERALLIGNETDGGYYATLEGAAGIFSIAKNRAPWRTFGVFAVISKRPLSPYIYSCENVVVTTPNGEYKFDIDSVTHTFSLNGKAVDTNGFKLLYQELIGSVGEELYTEQTDEAPYVSVKFNYKSEYHGIYGTDSDELSYLAFDGRKYAVNLNGKTLFKVGEIYVSRLIESVNDLV